MKNRITKSLASAFVALAVLFGGNAAFANPTAATGGKTAAKRKGAHPKTVRIKVSKDGFSPSTIEAEKGYPLTLIFTRTDAKNCGNKVVFRSLNISRNLPVGKPVTVKITPDKTGDISFTCGMGMYKGTIVAE
jgi:plastocyanin domain-containing protein